MAARTCERISLAPPLTRHVGVGTFRATSAMYAHIGDVLDSGRISYGAKSAEFERRFAALHGCDYAVLSNSGTSALQVALQAMREVHHWEGGRVVIPATTFVATANIVLHNRMVPVFVDVDPRTFCLDVGQLERVITRDTRAIIPVNLLGQAANLSAVRAIAEAHGVKVIEDSCEAMFVSHCGRPVGSWGDIGCFSTYVAHLLVTGVGGIATTANPEYAARMRSLVNHGLALDCLNPGANFAPRPMAGRRFRFVSAGHSFRITELEAALGLAQLDTVPAMLAARRANAARLGAALDAINAECGPVFQAPVVGAGNEHAWMMFGLVLLRGERESLLAHLNARGVETRDLLPLINQPAFAYLNPADFPVSAHLVTNAFYVGCHQDLTLDDMDYVADCLREWARAL